MVKNNLRSYERNDVGEIVQQVVKCKWALSVLDLVRRGISRPGAMVKQTPGLSTKVLNERLRKLERFGILERTVFPESPPRVEYTLTEFGLKFDVILKAIDDLQADISDNAT